MQKLIILFVIIGLFAVVSCKRKTRLGITKETAEKVEIVPIAKILDNPEEYQKKDREWAVRGYVTQVIDVPGIKLDVFKIFDGTDEIWIYTNKGIPPINIIGMVKGDLSRLLDVSFTISVFVKIPIIPEMQYFIMLKEFEFD